MSGLRFIRGNAKNAKITIGFTNHDGPWGVLGRAWFPKVGKILFEKKENWVTDIPSKNSQSKYLNHMLTVRYVIA